MLECIARRWGKRGHWGWRLLLGALGGAGVVYVLANEGAGAPEGNGGMVYLAWGDAPHWQGDVYDATGPRWWVGAYKEGGTVDAEAGGWHVDAAEPGQPALYMEVDRSRLARDVVLDVTLVDHSLAALQVDLLDTEQRPVLLDLYGNMLAGSEEVKTLRCVLPLGANPAAALIRLRRAAGEATLLNCALTPAASATESAVSERRGAAAIRDGTGTVRSGVQRRGSLASVATGMSSGASIPAGSAGASAVEDAGCARLAQTRPMEPGRAAGAGPARSNDAKPRVTIRAPVSGSRILW